MAENHDTRLRSSFHSDYQQSKEKSDNKETGFNVTDKMTRKKHNDEYYAKNTSKNYERPKSSDSYNFTNTLKNYCNNVNNTTNNNSKDNNHNKLNKSISKTELCSNSTKTNYMITKCNNNNVNNYLRWMETTVQLICNIDDNNNSDNKYIKRINNLLDSRCSKSKIKCTLSCFKNSNKLFKLALLIIIGLVFKVNFCYGFQLTGSENSYAMFRKWYAGLNGTLELEFKTEQPNGLLLYTDDGGTYDFFELKLVEGTLRLRYNLGGGAQIISVGRDLHDGHWHKVQVSFVT